MKQEIIIIGGGASGLAAAVVASGLGAGVTLLERGKRAGRKVLASGNGRCNLANVGEPRYYGGEAFALTVLSRMPVNRVLDFFHSIGVETRTEDGGRVYPACNQAAAVLDALRVQCTARGVSLQTECDVHSIEKDGHSFRIGTNRGDFRADRVIAACGGAAAPALGGWDASGLLTALGHTLITPAPALSPLVTQKEPLRGLSGLRAFALLTLTVRDTPLAAAQGEALFADDGISGVCAMQLARDAHNALQRGLPTVLHIDFSPMLNLIPHVLARVTPQAPDRNVERVLVYLQDRSSRLSVPDDQLLTGAVPRVLRERLGFCALPQTACRLADYSLRVVGTRGLEGAQVTQGGLDTCGFSPETMESRRVPGLYAAGEMLDVDGDCGGFNLLFAFASGILAGQNASTR